MEEEHIGAESGEEIGEVEITERLAEDSGSMADRGQKRVGRTKIRAVKGKIWAR